MLTQFSFLWRKKKKKIRYFCSLNIFSFQQNVILIFDIKKIKNNLMYEYYHSNDRKFKESDNVAITMHNADDNTIIIF